MTSNEYKHAWAKANPERRKAHVDKYNAKRYASLKKPPKPIDSRRCSKCGVTHPLFNFNKDKTGRGGYGYCCKPCAKARSKRQQLETPQALVKHRQKWAETHPACMRAARVRRRTKERNAVPAWLSSDDFWFMDEIYELAKIRERVVGGKWHVDHIVPLQGKTVCGLHVPWNLQVIPAVENLRKSNKLHA